MKKQVVPIDGDRVERILFERSMSKKELARRGKIGYSTIYAAISMRSGTLRSAKAIAKALGIPLSEITIPDQVHKPSRIPVMGVIASEFFPKTAS